MFRKIAIALVAASALTAPVLAQQTTNPSAETKVSPTAPAPSISSTEKTEKLTTKPTKHRMAARHHHRGAKMAKYTKSHGAKMGKYAKYGKYTHPMKHGRTAGKHAFGAVSAKAISSKPAAKPSLKRSTRPGLD